MGKNYKTYSWEDFSTDEEFKRWVLQPDKELNYYWNKILESYPDQRPDILKARELILMIKFNSIDQDFEEREEALNNILKNRKSFNFIESVNENNYRRSSSNINWFYAAASLLLIAVASYYLSNLINRPANTKFADTEPQIIYKSNPAGQKLTLKFPDGSQAILNSESDIHFPARFNDSIRLVELSGEAYFDIVKDGRPFMVKTGNITTRVLGTSFNVNAFPEIDQITVALVEGKVEVIAGKDESIELAPSEKLEVHRRLLTSTKSHFDPVVEAGWKDGILVFEGDDFKSVISKLERWYGVFIKLENTPHREWQLRGKFKDLSLEQLLQNLKFTNKIGYDINGNQVTLKF